MTSLLAKELTRIGKLKGLNSTKMAEHKGIDKSVLSHRRSGVLSMSVDQFVEWCKMLGVKPHLILEKFEFKTIEIEELIGDKKRRRKSRNRQVTDCILGRLLISNK